MEETNNKKRLRITTNFTSGEVAQLISIAAKYKDIIENRKTDILANKEKDITWDKITTAFNAVVPLSRTSYTLRTKYESIKKAAKKKAALFRQEMYKTGILQKCGTIFTPIEAQMLALCNMPGFENRYDLGEISAEQAQILLSSPDAFDLLDLEHLDDADPYLAPQTTPRNDKRSEGDVSNDHHQYSVNEQGPSIIVDKTNAMSAHTASSTRCAPPQHTNPSTPRSAKTVRTSKSMNVPKTNAEKPKMEKLIELKLELLELQKINAQREMDYKKLEFDHKKEEHEMRMAQAEIEGHKHQQFPLSNLVYFNKIKRASYCLLCWRRFAGLSQKSIKRHYTKQHGYCFKEETKLASDATDPHIKGHHPSRSLIHVQITRNKFLKCCMGLVAMHNIPLEVFNDDDYFKQLIQPYEQAFGTNLNADKMSEQIAECAGKIKEKLRKSFNNYPMSLKADIATTQTGEHKLLLTVHYLKDFMAQAHTIGVISLPAEQLSEQITACLADFGIDVSQIYSFVTEFGPVRWFHDKKTIEIEYETIHSLLATDFGAIRCTRQILNMAASDTIKDFHTPLAGCRSAVDSLQRYIRSVCPVENECAPATVKDNSNYWLSIYKMIESLLNARSYINLNNIEKCFNAPWLFAEKFVEAFKPMVECLNNVQPNEYIVGDFYRDWLLCEAKLEKMLNNRVADNLLTSMVKYKEEFMCDEPFNIAALYFDPRFNYLDSPLFTEDKKTLAVTHLLKTSIQINSGNPEFLLDAQQTAVDENSNPTATALQDPFEDLELKVRSVSNNNSIDDTTLANQTISHLIDMLVNTRRVPFRGNILDYWRKGSIKEKQLNDLAQIVLAVPTNQTAAEPAFSALSAILSNQPSKLSHKIVQDMLMIKLNYKLLDEVPI